MPPETWAEIEAVFADAVDAHPADRPALLDRSCAGRPALRAEVESLLAAHARAGDFILPVTCPSEPAGDWPAGPREGDAVGPYRLMERVGEGGMGIVYRAERVGDAFRQRVAIKVTAAPALLADGGRRFRAERQILAALQHPHIVTFLDGGFTAQGTAYLVMEYVEGSAITTFCRDRRLALAARLALFRQVCAAVHHAHRHGVVHCDIKPANVIVTSDGVAKVLDFGVARLLDGPSGQPHATLTEAALRPLTPNYASPEQLRGLGVTTSVDIYSLGVLLYELLTGARPYETAGVPLDEVLRRVVDAEPRRPSLAGRTVDPGLPYDPRRALKGDLDAIVARAMDTVPERRYASAQTLGDDVGRHLDGAPIEARRPSLRYLAGKLAARHRVALAVSAGALVLLLAAFAVTLWQVRVARAERARADRRFEEVRKLANSLIFTIHDAVAPLAGSTPVRRTIIAEALGYLERLAAEARDDRRLTIELARAYVRVGRVQGHPQVANLGDHDGAIASFRKAQDLVRALATSPDASLEAVAGYVEAGQALSQVLVVKGSRAEAIDRAEEAVAVADAFAGRTRGEPSARYLLATASFSAAAALGFPRSGAYFERALTLFEGLLADSPDDPVRQRNVALAEKYLGAYEEERNDFAAALRHHLRASEIDEGRVRRDPSNRLAQFDAAIDLGNIGLAYSRTGDPARAAGFHERSLAIREHLAATDPQDVLARSKVAFAHRQLARVYRDAGRPVDALSHARQAVAIFDDLGTSDAYNRMELSDALVVLGEVQRVGGRTVESCAAYARALAIMPTVAEVDRRARHGGTDPLPDLKAAAARCPTAAGRR